MQWNELSKKTAGIIIVLIVIFAGMLGILAVILIRQRGGDDIARIVREAVESQHITNGTEGDRIVADRLLVTFRPDVSEEARQNIVRKLTGAKILGTVADQPSTYIISFSSVSTARQLNGLREIFMQSPDVADAQLIRVE